MNATTTRYEFLQHMTSGDIFAVEMDSNEQVVASIGPLYYTELTWAPSDFALRMTVEDNDWINGSNDWRLLSQDEALQKANL